MIRISWTTGGQSAVGSQGIHSCKLKQTLVFLVSDVRPGVRIRHQSGSKLTHLVGPGEKFMHSEVLTLRAVIQWALLLKYRLLLEQETAKTDFHVMFQPRGEERGFLHQIVKD